MYYRVMKKFLWFKFYYVVQMKNEVPFYDPTVLDGCGMETFWVDIVDDSDLSDHAEFLFDGYHFKKFFLFGTKFVKAA